MTNQHKTSTKISRDPQHLDDLAPGSDAISRHRRHGADIAADQRRGTIGSYARRAIIPGVTLLIAGALIHEAGGAASQEEANAAHQAAPIEKALNDSQSSSPTQPQQQ